VIADRYAPTANGVLCVHNTSIFQGVLPGNLAATCRASTCQSASASTVNSIEEKTFVVFSKKEGEVV
jgi:hypothetical protein